MKRFKGFFLAVSLFFFALASSPLLAADSEGGGAVVAKVGNISITQLDVYYEMQKIIPMQLNFHAGIKKDRMEEIQAEAAQAVIDRAYKVQYAIDEKISVKSSVIDKKWQSLAENNAKSLANATAAQVAKYKAFLYLDLLAEKAEAVAIDETISIAESEVLDHYTKNVSQYYKPKSFTASHIFVSVSPSDNKEELAAKLDRVNKLLQRAKAGEDFYNLAYYESDDRSKYVGGSLGSFHEGQTVEEFDSALAKMKPGEITGPVRTMYGYHVIKLDKVEPGRQLNFEEASQGVRSSLKKKSREAKYSQWVLLLQERYPVVRY